ncbi:MAG: phosphatase PAP2 family protein [Bacteroidales bacterium]|nr:phosphatase PAP2 family protein [Bacteroidales bacterium]
MNAKHLIFLLFLILISRPVSGDTIDVVLPPRPELKIKEYLYDVPKIFVAPFKADGKQWLRAGLLTSGVGLSMIADRPVNEAFTNKGTTSPNLTKYVLDPMGNGLITLPALGTIGAYAWLKRDQDLFDYAATAGWAFVFTRVLTQIPKYSFQRERPLDQIKPDPFAFHGLLGNRENKSFVSGHTASMFAFAAVTYHWFPENRAYGWIAYGLATAVGVSRLWQNEHWLSDVVGGAVLGYLCGDFIARRHKSISKSPLSLSYSSNGIGFRYTF